MGVDLHLRMEGGKGEEEGSGMRNCMEDEEGSGRCLAEIQPREGVISLWRPTDEQVRGTDSLIGVWMNSMCNRSIQRYCCGSG